MDFYEIRIFPIDMTIERQYIAHYNPPINFRVILLATLRHVVQIAGQLSRNNPRPI